MTFIPNRFPWASTIPLVGLGYRSGAGKDTVADILVKKHRFVKVSFAAALKRAARDLCGFTEEQVNGSLAEKEAVDPRWGFSPRWFMQRFGTEVGRAIDTDFWVRVLDARLRSAVTPTYSPGSVYWLAGSHEVASDDHRVCGVAITDCRFPNELAAVKAWGGVAVLVHRASAHAVVSDHASETSLVGAEFNYVLGNNGTLDELSAATTRLLDAICTDVVVDRGF